MLLDCFRGRPDTMRDMKDTPKTKKSDSYTAKYSVQIPLSREVVVLARAILEQDEGKRSQPYDDATGQKVRGAGFITIGIGRNLDGFPLTQEEVEMMFAVSLSKTAERAIKKFPGLHKFDPPRQVGLISLAYQLAGFDSWTKTPKLVEAGKWEELREFMKGWKWARQTPKRSQRVIELVCDNRIPKAYGI